MTKASTILALAAAAMTAGAVQTGAAQSQMNEVAPKVEVVPRGEVTFRPLNPLRGDASPKAGVLWGDLTKLVPTGAIIEFAEGFSSPPHIHNITYRAVVISGAVHNDDPAAEMLWMGPGSFWTQPAGEPHITAAAPGAKATAFLEILEGPYLVQPTGEAFDNGERPLNMEARNIVWLDADDVTWIEQPEAGKAGVRMAFLWGSPLNGQKNGSFVRLPAGFRGELRGNGAQLRAVVIQGEVAHSLAGDGDATRLPPGSYLGSAGGTTHRLSCAAGADCILYVNTEGKYEVAGS